MRTGLGHVAVFQAVIVVVLNGVLVWTLGKWPETVEVNLVAEASRQGVHQ